MVKPISLSLSLSPLQTWPYQGWSPVSSISRRRRTPWILLALDPGTVASRVLL